MFYSSNLFKDFFLSNMKAQIEAKMCNNLKSKFVNLIHILSQIGLAPCFSPKYKIIGKFEGFYFLSVVLAFPIFGSSSLQINKSTKELGKNTKERKCNFLSDILNSCCHDIKVSTQ